jgi:hypothetical protein
MEREGWRRKEKEREGKRRKEEEREEKREKRRGFTTRSAAEHPHTALPEILEQVCSWRHELP